MKSSASELGLNWPGLLGVSKESVKRILFRLQQLVDLKFERLVDLY